MRLFDGEKLLQPAVHSAINLNDFKTLSLVFSHAYLACGILPDRVASPCLAKIFLGAMVSDALLIDSFLSSLYECDAKVIMNSLYLTSYPPEVTNDLITIFSCHGCKYSSKSHSVDD